MWGFKNLHVDFNCFEKSWLRRSAFKNFLYRRTTLFQIRPISFSHRIGNNKFVLGYVNMCVFLKFFCYNRTSFVKRLNLIHSSFVKNRSTNLFCIFIQTLRNEISMSLHIISQVFSCLNFYKSIFRETFLNAAFSTNI